MRSALAYCEMHCKTWVHQNFDSIFRSRLGQRICSKDVGIEVFILIGVK